MPLDPQVQAFLESMPPLTGSLQGIPLIGKTLGSPATPSASKRTYVARVEERIIPETSDSQQIPVRIYTPEGSGPFPILMFFHGGGFEMDSLENHDVLCRKLTRGAGCLVVAVKYRVAPQHKFPQAVNDSYTATKWVFENAGTICGDPSRIAVGGDSAGGNLAAGVTLLSRDKGAPPLVFQLLLYPATDFSYSSASINDDANAYFITREDMLRIRNNYLNNAADIENPLSSPLKAPSLAGLPPALVITAEFDPLRDEGEAYAARLRQAGIAVASTRYSGMIHAFMTFPLDKGKMAIQEAATALRAAFAK